MWISNCLPFLVAYLVIGVRTVKRFKAYYLLDTIERYFLHTSIKQFISIKSTSGI